MRLGWARRAPARRPRRRRQHQDRGLFERGRGPDTRSPRGARRGPTRAPCVEERHRHGAVVLGDGVLHRSRQPLLARHLETLVMCDFTPARSCSGQTLVALRVVAARSRRSTRASRACDVVIVGLHPRQQRVRVDRLGGRLGQAATTCCGGRSGLELQALERRREVRQLEQGDVGGEPNRCSTTAAGRRRARSRSRCSARPADVARQHRQRVRGRGPRRMAAVLANAMVTAARAKCQRWRSRDTE